MQGTLKRVKGAAEELTRLATARRSTQADGAWVLLAVQGSVPAFSPLHSAGLPRGGTHKALAKGMPTRWEQGRRKEEGELGQRAWL